MPNKPISLSIAAAGCGKTTAFVQALPSLFEQQKRVVIALPTTKLADDVEKRSIEELTKVGCDTRPHLMHSGSQNNVHNALEAVLQNKNYRFVICTHESLTAVKPEVFRGWITVVDEVPRILDTNTCNLDEEERRSIFEYAEVVEGRLVLLWGKKTLLKERMAKLTVRTVDTTISDNERAIFGALLDEVTVWVDPIDRNRKQAFRIIRIDDYRSVINHSDEFHVMCATFNGTLFEGFCKYWEAIYMPSIFTPKNRMHEQTHWIRLYPLLKDIKFSKSLYLSEYKDGYRGENKSYYSGGQWLDYLLKQVAMEVGEEECLLFTNKGIRFKWLENREQWEYCPFDSRGSNLYTSYKNAAVLFCCNADGLNRRNFKTLEEMTGISAEEWERRWDVTHTYEMAYQALARTALRLDEDSDEIVKLFVPDMYHVEYLSKFFPDAVVDESLCQVVRKTTTLRTPPHILEYICHLHDSGVRKQLDIVDLVKNEFDYKISRQTVGRILNKRNEEFMEGISGVASTASSYEYPAATTYVT